jgi:uncharacterized membrane protein
MHIIPSSWSHLHILVTIFPSVGLIFVLCVYTAGLALNNEQTKRISLMLIALLGLLAVPTLVSGLGSMSSVAALPDVSQELIDTHYTWGMAGVVALLIMTAAAGLELWRARSTGKLSDQMPFVILGIAVAVLAMMVLVDENGWEISHNELRAETAGGGTPQSWSHVHIILNHFPTAGLVMALVFFVTGLMRNSDALKRAGLAIFSACAILAVPTYVTGAASMWALTQPLFEGINFGAINAHRDMALLTLFGVGLTGGAAWIELWRYRHLGRFSQRSLYIVLGLAIVTLLIMAETGHRGGLINHPEIRTAADVFPEDPIAGFWSPAIENRINTIIWFVPWQTLHFFGYSMIFATVLLVTLRILGAAKSVPFSTVHRLLPIAFFGVALNVFSGMLLLMADTFRYVNNTTFAPKIALIAIGGIAALYFSLSEDLWKVKAGDSAPLGAKAAAVLVLAAWSGVIMGGRLLPYL